MIFERSGGSRGESERQATGTGKSDSRYSASQPAKRASASAWITRSMICLACFRKLEAWFKRDNSKLSRVSPDETDKYSSGGRLSLITQPSETVLLRQEHSRATLVAVTKAAMVPEYRYWGFVGKRRTPGPRFLDLRDGRGQKHHERLMHSPRPAYAGVARAAGKNPLPVRKTMYSIERKDIEQDRRR